MAGEAPMDWQNQLEPNSRQRIVDRIMRTPEGYLPVFGQEILQELIVITRRLNEIREIAVGFEEEAYTAAISQADYLQRFTGGPNQNP